MENAIGSIDQSNRLQFFKIDSPSKVSEKKNIKSWDRAEEMNNKNKK
jgi:hypothetical protein